MAIKLSKDAEHRAIDSIKRYFLEDRDEEMGDLQARLLLDFFMKEVGPLAYNQGVADAQAYMRDRVADVDGVCHEQEFGYFKKRA